MPTFTFEGPGGQRRTIEGPEGATREDAIKMLNQHLAASQPAGGPDSTPNSLRSTPGMLKSAASGMIQGAGAPGDLSNSVLGGAPEQQPVDKETYYGKLVEALNAARKHLELPTTQQVGNTVGMQPTTPVTPAEKIVQGGATMVPGAMMGGAGAGARAAMGVAPAANAVRGMGLSPQGPASSIAQGAAGAAPQGVGDALQNQLLKAGLEHGANAVGHLSGIPMAGTAARAAVKFLPKVLGFDK